MSKKNIEATATEATATEAPERKHVSVKEKAKKYIEIMINHKALPMVFEEVLTAYAAIGILKYDEVLEMSDTYASTFIIEEIDK